MKRKGLADLNNIIAVINRAAESPYSTPRIDILPYSNINDNPLNPDWSHQNIVASILRETDTEASRESYYNMAVRLICERFGIPQGSEDLIQPVIHFIVPIDEEAIKKIGHFSSTAGLRAPLFNLIGENDFISHSMFNVGFHPPTGIRQKLNAKKVYLNEDIPFQSYFIQLSLQVEILKYLYTKALAPVYKIVLNSKYVPEDTKAAIIEGRYFILEMIEALEKCLTNNQDVLGILKNVTEKNEAETIQRLSALIRSADSPSSKANSLSDQGGYKIWVKNNRMDIEYSKLTGVGNILRRTYIREVKRNDIRDSFYRDLLVKYLKNDEKMGAADIEELMAITAATRLAQLTAQVMRHLSDSLSDLSNSYSDCYTLRRVKPGKLDQILAKTATIGYLLNAAITFGNLDFHDFQKFLNKLIAKVKIYEPKGKAASEKSAGPFDAFVIGIGGAYDTEDVDSEDNTKEISKILKNLAKKVSVLAGVPLKPEPEETVSFALRKYSDDDSKMNEIYDLVDEAVNECYDLAFGESPVDEDDV